MVKLVIAMGSDTGQTNSLKQVQHGYMGAPLFSLLFTDTHPRTHADQNGYNANEKIAVELPFEELGSQRASNNSYGSPRYQKKAPRKKNHKNNEDGRVEENVFTTDHDNLRGSK